MKKPKIIYFLADGIPSAEEIAIAESFGVKVMYRNVRFIESTDHPEECDAVVGSVIPEQYKDKPGPEEALKEYAERLKAQREIVGDIQAPSVEEVKAMTAEQSTAEIKNPAIKSNKPNGWARGK